MNRKKGFTLIEMIAVIALIGVLMILIVPNILKTFDSSKKSTFTTQVKRLYNMADQNFADIVASGESYNDKDIIFADNVTGNVIANLFDGYDDFKLQSLDLEVPNARYIFSYANGKLYEMGYSDGNFCYYKNRSMEAGSPYDYYYYYYYSAPSISMNVEDSDINTGGTLTCDEEGCSCVGGKYNLPIENGYLYWTNGSAFSNRISSNSTTDYLGRDGHTFMRTLIENSNVVKHEVCYQKNSNTICIGPDYWTSNTSATLNKLKNELSSKFGVSNPECETNNYSSYSTVTCYYDGATFHVESDKTGYIDLPGSCGNGEFSNIRSDGFASHSVVTSGRCS